MHDTRLLNPQQVSSLLGVHKRTLSRWRTAGTGPRFIRLGNAIRYEATEVAQWLESRKYNSIAEERSHFLHPENEDSA